MASFLRWYGAAVEAKVHEAERKGIDATAVSCVETARDLVNKDTTTLEGSIHAEPAVRVGGGYRAQWGSFDVDYALWQELLPGESAAGVTRVEAGGKPYLRPAADQHYPELPANILKEMG